MKTLVHIPSSHAAGYADVLEMAEEHTIIIAGKYPDIIGFSPTDEIVDQFDAAECNRDEGGDLYEKGQRLLAEVRDYLNDGSGDIVDLE